MYITLFRLSKYKRLMMSNIQSFEWTPTKNLLIMIGSNGSGKSSIMDELSPIPSRHTNFEKGGEKEFHCTHNGSRYLLLSKYGHGTGSHSFQRDNQELNPGGTFKVQEDLCYQEFGLTKELHDICTGRIKFTQLSTAKRREILTRMSVVNLDETFDLFRALKNEHRSQKGVVDTITKRLVNDNGDIPSDSEMNLMKQETLRMNNRLNMLFQEKGQPKKSFFSNLGEAQAELEGIIRSAKDVLYRYPYMPKKLIVKDHTEYQAEYALAREQYSAIKAVINRMAEELDNLRSTTPDQIEIAPETITELSDAVAVLEKEIRELEPQLRTYNEAESFPLVSFDLMGDSSRKLDTLFERLYEAMNAFPENASGEMNKGTAATRSERLKALKVMRNQLDSKYTQISQRVARLKGCESVVCPKCEHDFKPGVDPNEAGNLEKVLESLSDQLDELDTEAKGHEEYLERFQEYCGHVHNYTQITREYREFDKLWEFIGSRSIMYRTPAAHKGKLLEWYHMMELHVAMRLKTQTLNVKSKRLAELKAIDKDAVAYTRERCEALEHEINTKYTSAQDLSSFLSEMQQCETEILRNINEIEDIVRKYTDWRNRVQQHAEWCLEQAYTAEISSIHVKLAETTRTLHQMEQRETTIRALENEVTNSTTIMDDLGILIKGISPNGGLLGRYLMGFMQGVVTIVNAYIDEVWTYPMEVLPSKVDRDELDYNFPLKVAGGKVIAADISNGSDSQLEIVNFGFCMAMRKFFHLDEFPLFLDETGRTFDEQHRENFIPFVNRLIENGQFRQVFFISHFSSQHGAFNQAEIMVLDPTNVTVPEVYNKNVLIK
ncbi:SbcC protein [Pseudomonas phage Phabio]|uniref:SbcC protein n=1 Tax=Pseudomonas phage Phabio TaxID=2006668 RepID=A0A1Y0SZC8_9CAUD|nr:SbcC protein [Pseudomonas phage Phabio]ARV76869.1 SbcC protein [Pseudomonas phage Phabio]